MNITVTIQTDDVAGKLKEVRQEPTNKVRDLVSPRVVEMMNLLKKRLDRQSEPMGG